MYVRTMPLPLPLPLSLCCRHFFQSCSKGFLSSFMEGSSWSFWLIFPSINGSSGACCLIHIPPVIKRIWDQATMLCCLEDLTPHSQKQDGGRRYRDYSLVNHKLSPEFPFRGGKEFHHKFC